MSVYVGIDVHRKRSQVAVIDKDGEVLANRNVPNGAETVLGVIGGLPPGTPVAFGRGWLVELLEDCGPADRVSHVPHQRRPVLLNATQPAGQFQASVNAVGYDRLTGTCRKVQRRRRGARGAGVRQRHAGPGADE
jgi:hypothetical protein